MSNFFNGSNIAPYNSTIELNLINYVFNITELNVNNVTNLEPVSGNTFFFTKIILNSVWYIFMAK